MRRELGAAVVLGLDLAVPVLLEPPPRTFIERVAGADVDARALERWKRLRRQGWRLSVVQELEGGDVLAFGYLEPNAELEPDRAGQLELDVET